MPKPSLDGIVRKHPPVTTPEVKKPSSKTESKPHPVKPKNPDPAELSTIRKFVTILVLASALAIIIIDTTLLNVSLTPIIHDLHTNIQSLQWVITSYALVLAALTITGGRLGDLYGRKKFFIGGAIIFAIGSFLASISQRLGVLVAGESIIEGVGAALMMPATASLLLSTFRGRQRALAFGVWGGVAAASSAIGPLLGGYLTTHYSWRWGFRINVAVAALLVLGSFIIKESRDTEEKPQLDIFGVILSATGLLAVVFGIIESATYGWFKAKAPYAVFGHVLSQTISVSAITIVAGLALIIFFVIWQAIRKRLHRTPLVNLEIFRSRQFSAGTVTTGVMSLSMVGLIFVLPVFLQAVRGLDALHTGLTLLPMSATMLVVGPASAYVSKYIPAKWLIMGGLLINLAAALLLRAKLGLDTTSLQLAPIMVLYGFGMGMVMAQISNLTLSGVSVQQAGEASGVNNTLRQVGSSLGTAIIGAIMIAELSTRVASGINASAVIPANLKPQIAASASAQSQNVAFGAQPSGESNLPETIRGEITRVGHQATVDGAKAALLYGAGFAGLGFLIAIALPGHKELDREHVAATGGH